ncbi:MAG: Serine/threonine-protein kinase BtrW [Chlamydiae bacterium]|nr:Serine/threonine-protein kinase BtrW [Chlamydiota bacterium]
MSSDSFPATIAKLPSILSWVRFHLDQTSLSKSEKMRFEIAMEEAIVNVIHHAKIEKVHLSVRHEPGRQIAFDLTDPGPPFNPLMHPEPLKQKPLLEEQSLGGKGLLLIRKCTDALSYRREDDMNILTLVKKLSSLS